MAPNLLFSISLILECKVTIKPMDQWFLVRIMLKITFLFHNFKVTFLTNNNNYYYYILN